MFNGGRRRSPAKPRAGPTARRAADATGCGGRKEGGGRRRLHQPREGCAAPPSAPRRREGAGRRALRVPRTYRCPGDEAAQLGLEAAHGPCGAGAEAEIGVPLRGAADEQRQRLLHGRRTARTAAPPSAPPTFL